MFELDEILFVLSTMLVVCFGGYPFNPEGYHRLASLSQKSNRNWFQSCVQDCLARVERFYILKGSEHNSMPSDSQLRVKFIVVE